jgi:hypothetical protein
MSQLQVSLPGVSYLLNVIGFSSMVYETIAGAQTNTLMVYFPIKYDQPDVTFDVVFASEIDFQNFQAFVRTSQQQAVANASLVTLNWPQRNINNWTGTIRSFQAGGMRFNPAPHARFSVDLVDSIVNQRTEFASIATPWQAIYGGVGMPPDAVLAPPNQANLATWEQFGVNLVTANSGLTVPLGILTGTGG